MHATGFIQCWTVCPLLQFPKNENSSGKKPAVIYRTVVLTVFKWEFAASLMNGAFWDTAKFKQEIILLNFNAIIPDFFPPLFI